MPDALLRPTVKRDISLFSVQAWQKGYEQYVADRLGWRYDILFFYDGQRVNFYHRAEDFDHFKSVITQRLIEDDALFERLNELFLDDVSFLESVRQIRVDGLSEIFERIASSMSFYIFVVSDRFVAARPEAWESRNRSEGILYELDEQVEEYVKRQLRGQDADPRSAHFLQLDEILSLARGETIPVSAVMPRTKRYILKGDKLVTDVDFDEYCRRHGLVNPESSGEASFSGVVRGTAAYGGTARGTVRIIMNRGDLHKVMDSDIVVAGMTNTTYLPALAKSAAFVTDEGGITCHAAIAARELKKPCIIGTKIATQVLKDGDRVEVDAEKGVVRKI